MSKKIIIFEDIYSHYEIANSACKFIGHVPYPNEESYTDFHLSVIRFLKAEYNDEKQTEAIKKITDFIGQDVDLFLLDYALIDGNHDDDSGRFVKKYIIEKLYSQAPTLVTTAFTEKHLNDDDVIYEMDIINKSVGDDYIHKKKYINLEINNKNPLVNKIIEILNKNSKNHEKKNK